MAEKKPQPIIVYSGTGVITSKDPNVKIIRKG